MSAVRGRPAASTPPPARRRTTRRPGRSVSSRLVRSLAVYLLLLAVLAGVGIANAVVIGSSGAAELRQERLRQANTEMLLAMTNAETGVRGYRLAGDRRFLEPYDLGRTDFPRAVRAAADLSDRQDERDLVRAQRDVARGWFADFADVGAAKPVDAPPPTLEQALARKATFDRFRALNTRLDVLVDRRARAAAADAERARQVVLWLSVVTVALALAAAVAVHRRLRASLVAPLGHVVTTLGRLAAGRYDARADVGLGPREVQVVAASLNTLADEADRLRAEQAATARYQDLAVEISRELRDEVVSGDPISTTLRRLGEVLDVDRVYVRVLAEGEHAEDTHQWNRPPWAPLPATPADEAYDRTTAQRLEQYYRTLRPWVCEDTEERAREDEHTARYVERTGARAALVVAVGASGTALGLLTAMTLGGPRAWTHDEERLMTSVAADLGRALVVSRLLEQQERLVDRLRELDRTKTEFVATVSHELRTPLTSIAGYVEMVREGDGGEVPPAMDAMLAVVERNTARLRLLIEDLLTLSRIESGTYRVSHGEVAPVQVASMAVQSLRPAADKARVSVHLDLGRGGGGRRAGLGRSRAAGAGGGQPAVQRGEVHPRRRAGARVGAPDHGPGGHRGRRHRHRDPRGRAGAAVHQVLPRLQRHRAGHPRHRAGDDDRALRRRAPRRHPDGGLGARGGHHRHRRPAAPGRPGLGGGGGGLAGCGGRGGGLGGPPRGGRRAAGGPVSATRPAAPGAAPDSVDAGPDPAEAARLATLAAHGLAGPLPGGGALAEDPELVAAVRLAVTLTGAARASLNVFDAHDLRSLVVAARPGSPGDHGAAGTPDPRAFDCSREESMCEWPDGPGATRLRSAAGAEAVHTADAAADPLWHGNPFVDGRRGRVRGFATVPLLDAQGLVLGSLCVLDTAPLPLAPGALAALGDLARVAAALLQRRLATRVAQRSAAAAEEQRALAEERRALLDLLYAESTSRGDLVDAVLDTVEVAVVACDGEGRVILFNRAARDWHGGYPDPEVDAEGNGERYGLYDVDGLTVLSPDRVPLHRALAGQAVEDEEMILAPPGMPRRTVLSSGRALTSVDGQVMGAVVAMSDVTDDRRRRAELQRSNTDLEHFAASASHDLAAPLAVVGGYLELVADECADVLDARALGWVETSRRGVARMQSLISALLAYARAGGAELRVEAVESSMVAGLALADLEASVVEAGAEVVLRELPPVLADPVLVRQLLQNLVSNALRHRRADRPCRVVLSAVRAGSWWIFAVADNGPGIAPSAREEVFDVFATGAKAAATPGARASGGHGIGLATCRRTVERHGGRIWVEPTRGGGATLRFTLPAA